ncbi:MAG: class I SAM-dependent methyltransferase [Candidatus Omnitrophica bacterium]|nr:class I SAM-dependent methyltransferase [Candidatus Omnitrophota bacterium]
MSDRYAKRKKEGAWEHILQTGKYRLTTPDPLVGERLREFHTIKKGAYLDLGCGLGRHLDVPECGLCIGLDSSMSALNAVRSRINPSIQLVRASMTQLPFCSESIDTILAWRSIYLLKIDQIECAINELYRVLCYGGCLLCSVRATTNTLYHTGREQGEQIEPGTFLFPEEEFHGAMYHFFSEDEIRQRFHKFEINKLQCRELEHTSFTVNRPQYKNNFWIFSARKF